MGGMALRPRPGALSVPDRAAAVAIVAVTATTVLLVFVNYEEKPAGIRLLEGPARESIWTMPAEWAQNLQPELVPVTRVVRERAEPGETIALTRNPVVRPFIDAGWPELVHRLEYADSLAEAAEASAAWAVFPDDVDCEDGWRLELHSPPWAVYRQVPGTAADSGTVPPMPSSLSILMPVFNELATVEAAIDDALTAELPVDARAARDRRRRLDRRHPRAARLEELPDNVTIVEHDRNRGKGAALRTGLQHATGDWSAILDADLEYRASDLGRCSSRS